MEMNIKDHANYYITDGKDMIRLADGDFEKTNTTDGTPFATLHHAINTLELVDKRWSGFEIVWGCVSFQVISRIPDERVTEEIKSAALAKLTVKEKEVLGL